MKIFVIGVVACAGLCAAPTAFADAYKCVRADGSTSFQDRPCPPGATSRTIDAAPAAGPAQPVSATTGRASWADASRDADRKRLDQETKARNDQAEAFDKSRRCNFARQQLGVLRDGGRAFRRDDAGERHYIDDKDRARETTAAQRQVADACS